MRCPNCGNENPADYVFCDECGARLQPMSENGQSDSAPVAMADNAATGMGDSPPAMSASDGDGSGLSGEAATGTDSTDSAAAQPSADVDNASSTIGGWQPPPTTEAEPASWQSPMPPTGDTSGSDPTAMPAPDAEAGGAGSAGWNAAGMRSTGEFDEDEEDDSGGAGVADPALTGDEAEAPTATYNAWDRPGAISTISVGSADEDEEPVPATEDTIADGSGMGEGGADVSYGGQADAQMPGVVPMVGAYGADADASTMGGSDAAGGDDWMAATMRHLDEAQRALDNLRSHLSSGLGAAAAEAGTALDAGSDYGASAVMPGSPSGMMGSTDSTQAESGAGMGDFGSSPMEMGYGAADTSGAVSSPMLEPAAEAGTLDASSAGMDSGMAGGVVQEAPPASGEPIMARLVVIATGAEMPLPDQEEITVGREDPSSGIFPDVDLTPYGGEDGGVSRRHAKLLRIGDDFFVEDLQSTNYTKLDGQRLPAHVRERLEDGARVDFGRVATIFRRG